MKKLLIGGSPCTHWSIAQKNNREVLPEGIGWELFKNYLIAKEKFRPDFFLYENNKSAALVMVHALAKIGLISMKEYEQHKDILKLPRWWWLRTPNAANSYGARNVSTDGSLYSNYAYNGIIGVRPALYLKSDILVSKKIDLDAPFAQLQGITTEEIKPAPNFKAQRNVQDIIQPLYKHYSNLTELAETHKNNPPVIIPLSVEIRATAELIYRVRYGEVTE